MALDKERIVCAAVELLDADGLDGVTTRKLAARLGVQSPTLYWHFPNKAALVTAIAESILGQEFTELAPPAAGERWQPWLMGIAGRLRAALLAHPDGARVVSAAHLSVRMAAISELAMSTLVAHGMPLRKARMVVLTVERFTVGFVLGEQAPRPDAEALKDFDMAAFAAAHPTVVAGIAEYFEHGATVDDLFREGLELLVEGVGA